MDPGKPAADYTLEIFADPVTVRDVVRGVLHFIFFHRFFANVRPASVEVLGLTLPYVPDPELEAAIDARVYQLTRQLSSTTSPNSGARGQLAVQFFEKRRKKAAGLGWFGGRGAAAAADADVCWEVWRLEITLATPRTETEQAKVMRAMETTLQKTAMKIMKIVNRDKDHVPPITSNETNPFPYQIILNPRVEGWSKPVGLY